MSVTGVDHYNVVVADLERARRFYADVLGLREGDRPPFAQPGAWMYVGDQALLHLSTLRTPRTVKSDAFDHIALAASDLAAMRSTLRAHGIRFEEFAVPERDVHQVFFRDPDGCEIELVFRGEEARAARTKGQAITDRDASQGRNT